MANNDNEHNDKICFLFQMTFRIASSIKSDMKWHEMYVCVMKIMYAHRIHN